MRFHKYHGLGNDYLVLDPADSRKTPTPKQVELICHRNYGLGSDGILYGPLKSRRADFKLRIFNPDGGEAEKSGNGLRIFARYLWETKRAKTNKPFTVETLGGVVSCVVGKDAKKITVEMGQVTFVSKEIPVAGKVREVINEKIKVGGKVFTFCAASVGNPHCVLPMTSISSQLAHKYGPLLETHKLFPNRINVQFMKVIDRKTIQIEIWERGAGYTLASGSSSCAAAAVAHKLGKCGNRITVRMPGGAINVQIDSDYAITMSGPATRVGTFNMNPEVLKQRLPA